MCAYFCVALHQCLHVGQHRTCRQVEIGTERISPSNTCAGPCFGGQMFSRRAVCTRQNGKSKTEKKKHILQRFLRKRLWRGLGGRQDHTRTNKASTIKTFTFIEAPLIDAPASCAHCALPPPLQSGKSNTPSLNTSKWGHNSGD